MVRRRAQGHAGALVLWLLLASFSATAQSPEADPAGPIDRGSLSFVIENDVFTGTDRNYTSGVLMAYLSPPRPEESGLRRFAQRIRLAAPTDRVRYGVSIGQSLFTPEDISVPEPLGDQHPYAGWLYVGGSFVVESARTLDTILLEVGIVGPAAQGEDTQKTVHQIVDTTEPRGWDNQLENEFGVALSYDRKWRGLKRWEMIGLEVDFTPNVGFSLGNILTQANLGATFRIGNDLANDFGPPRIRPSLAGSGPLLQRDNLGWYLFAGVVGRAVAHNIFLDGNTTRESQNVERRPWVGDAQAGLVVQLGRAQLGFTGVVRSKEYETQDEIQAFGALSFSIGL